MREETVGAALIAAAAGTPNRIALVGVRHGEQDWSQWTYAELLDARRVAGSLLRLVEPGDHIAVWAPNVAEWPIIEYGAALAGTPLVALNPVFRHRELADALGRSGARLLLHADVSRDYDMATVARDVTADLPELAHCISLSDAEAVRGGRLQTWLSGRPLTPPR